MLETDLVNAFYVSDSLHWTTGPSVLSDIDPLYLPPDVDPGLVPSPAPPPPAAVRILLGGGIMRG